MATITLYKDKINGVGSLLDNIIKSSNNFDTQLGTLKNTLQGVNSSNCNLQDTIDSISSSSKSEKEKVEDLKKLNRKLTDFITTTARRDSSARDQINKKKKDFYTKYSYLKPECEKSDLQKLVEGTMSVGEWCCKHWKLIATVALVAVAVVLLCTGVGSGLGAAIIAGACWGAISGAVIGGVAGGYNSVKNGGNFFEGFENGAFDGAVGGAIGGAITGGFSFALGPATTMLNSIARSAGIGALSSGTSNMCVTTIDYLAEHKTLNGALDDILISGFSGAISGGIMGGITGGLQYKISTKQNFIDQMSSEDAARYDQYWKKNGIGSEKTWNEFRECNPKGTIDDYLTIVREQSPWPKGYDPNKNIITLNEGDTFYMVLDSDQAFWEPGGFGLKENVTDVSFARNDMAIKYGWKKDCGLVAEYRIKPGIKLDVHAGPIGPQVDLGADKYLPGNLELTQYDLFHNFNAVNRLDYIEYVKGSLRKLK